MNGNDSDTDKEDNFEDSGNKNEVEYNDRDEEFQNNWWFNTDFVGVDSRGKCDQAFEQRSTRGSVNTSNPRTGLQASKNSVKSVTKS